MILNHLKIAIRNLWKSKGFSAINIIGLAIGLATCLLIMLFVLDELGYDGWIGCEYRPRTTTDEGLGWLKPYLGRGSRRIDHTSKAAES